MYINIINYSFQNLIYVSLIFNDIKLDENINNVLQLQRRTYNKYL